MGKLLMILAICGAFIFSGSVVRAEKENSQTPSHKVHGKIKGPKKIKDRKRAQMKGMKKIHKKRTAPADLNQK